LDYQNNYAESSISDDNAAKTFDILAINLSVLYNYFHDPIKLLNLYLAKFLDTKPTILLDHKNNYVEQSLKCQNCLDISAKPFFFRVQNYRNSCSIEKLEQSE